MDQVVTLPAFHAPEFPAHILSELAGPDAEAAFAEVRDVALELGFPMSIADGAPEATPSDVAAAQGNHSPGSDSDAQWMDTDPRRRGGREDVEVENAGANVDQAAATAEANAGYLAGTLVGSGEATGFLARLWGAIRGLGATTRPEERETGTRSSSR